MCIDLRGFGKSEGSLSFGFHEREDVRFWIEWARDVKGIRGKIGLHGGSYGASVGLQAIAYCNQIDCMAAIHPYTDLKEIIRDQIQAYAGFRWLPLVSWFIERKFLRAIGATTWSDVSALELFAQREVPPAILLIHGSADRVIPVEHSRRLKQIYPDQVEYIEIPGSGHDDLFSHGPPDLSVRINQFLNNHLLRD